jgi:hypothetical protein
MNPNRSIFPALLAGMMMLGLAAAAQNPSVPSPASPIIAHGPLLLNPSSDGADVVWFTDKSCVAWVDFGAGGDFKTFPQFKFEPAAGKNSFPVLGGPVDGVIKALVRPNQISIQVIDLKGLIVDQINIKAKTGKAEREGALSR